MLGQQQVFRHIEHEQRAHPVIRETLPHLGGEQEGEAARMAENLRRRRAVDCDSGCAISHRHTLPCHAPRMRGIQYPLTALEYPLPLVITGSSAFADDDKPDDDNKASRTPWRKHAWPRDCPGVEPMEPHLVGICG